LKQKIVLDAAPIIFAAKTGLGPLLPKLGFEFLATPMIKREVLAGDFPEKPIIEKMFSKLIKTKPPLRQVRSKWLHEGEESAISLAREEKARLISDDKAAVIEAKSIGVECGYSSFLVFAALKKKIIDKREAKNIFRQMTEAGWWCDAATLARIFDLLDEA